MTYYHSDIIKSVFCHAILSLRSIILMKPKTSYTRESAWEVSLKFTQNTFMHHHFEILSRSTTMYPLETLRVFISAHSISLTSEGSSFENLTCLCRVENARIVNYCRRNFYLNQDFIISRNSPRDWKVFHSLRSKRSCFHVQLAVFRGAAKTFLLGTSAGASNENGLKALTIKINCARRVGINFGNHLCQEKGFSVHCGGRRLNFISAAQLNLPLS